MICPRCKEEMIILELDNVEIDFCSECKGIWLDSGELEMLLENEEKNNLFNFFMENLYNNEEKLKCPVCSKKMLKVEFNKNELTITVDKCKKDHGIWFDENELYSIINESNTDIDSKVLKLLRNMFGITLS